MEKAMKSLPLGQEMPFTGVSFNALIEEQANLSHESSTHFMNSDGETDFIGSSSALSIMSSQCLQWLPGVIGSYNMERIMVLLNRFRSSSHLSFGDFTLAEKQQSRQDLPPKDIAAIYVDNYFGIFNRVLHLYDRATFDQYFAMQYSNNPPETASWYASINLVLCMGSKCRTNERHPAPEEPTRAWGYFQNAMSVVPELIFKNPTTMSIQALIAMTIIADSNLLFQTSSMLLSMAIRLALDKGFHRKLMGNNISPKVKASRENIFWTLYILDKAMCMRFGHPLLIDDDEISIDPPSPDAAKSNGQDRKLFRAFVDLALIQSKVYKWLYSARYQTKPVTHRLFLLGELDDYLQAWKDSLSPELQPEAKVNKNDPSHAFDFQSVMMLHLNYYYTVGTIHRVSLFLNLEPPRVEVETKDHSTGSVDQAELSALVCLSASRTTIHFLKYGNCTFDALPLLSWCTMYYVLAASLMIFAHIVRDPTGPEIESDLSYLRMFATTLQRSSVNGSSHSEALQALAELILNIAEIIVHQRKDQQQVEPLSAGLSSQHISYTPATHEQPPTCSIPSTMSAVPSSAIPQFADHSLSSAVNAAGGIYDFIFQSSLNPSPFLLSTPTANSNYSFTPLSMSEDLKTAEWVDPFENKQGAPSNSWYP
ncbi:hypothetical protein N7490_011814 [Penicillium lividum]|nr:hypothetical protein N7490_011814 [Penicillium lividum]